MESSKKKEKKYDHFSCRGADSNCRIVTVVRESHDYKCPRLQRELQYLNSDGSLHPRGLPYMCYCGDLTKEIPVVKQEDFLKNKIFDCYLYI